MSKTTISKIDGRTPRFELAGVYVRHIESLRDDYLPGVPLPHAFTAMLIVVQIFELHQAGDAASASTLARMINMPLTTVQRSLAQLKKMGVIERRGGCFVLSPAYFNNQKKLRGYRRRLVIARQKKLSELGTSTVR